MKRTISIFAIALSSLLAACGEEEKVGVSYFGYNHTDKSIVAIVVNGEGGILHAPANDGGGQACCVLLPRKWKPGLMATIKWQEDGDWLLDANGKEVIRSGKRVYVPAPWKERTVEVPKYEAIGEFYIHFVPADDVKVAVTLFGPRNPKHPYRFPDIPLISP